MPTPNTGIDALSPTFWGLAFDDIDIGEYNLQNLVERKIESQIGKVGEKVRVPLTPDFGLANTYTPGSPITKTPVTQEYKDVALTESKNQTFQLTDSELSMNPYDLLKIYGIPAAKSLLRTVNDYLYRVMLKSHYMVDSISSFTEDHIIDARVKLSQNEVPAQGRTLLASNEDYGAMLKFSGFKNVLESGDAAAKQRGVLGVKYNFEMRENNIISTYTPADLTGAVNNIAGYAAGVKTILVDGFNDDANPLRPGDVFTITGETGTPKHVVQSTVVTSSDTTSITFEPALASSVADDAVVTAVASKSILGFVPNAMAFAARPYGVLPSKSADSRIIEWMGLPIRINLWFSELVLNVQYDILYGGELVNPKRVVRILRP
jgi:hypothetical protein